MEMKRTSRRAGIAIVVAGLVVGLMPSVANAAADTGWLLNNACFSGTVDGAKVITINNARKVTAMEDGSSSGDIGLKIHYGGLLSSILWNASSATWTAPYDISEFRVYH